MMHEPKLTHMLDVVADWSLWLQNNSVALVQRMAPQAAAEHPAQREHQRLVMLRQRMQMHADVPAVPTPAFEDPHTDPANEAPARADAPLPHPMLEPGAAPRPAFGAAQNDPRALDPSRAMEAMDHNKNRQRLALTFRRLAHKPQGPRPGGQKRPNPQLAARLGWPPRPF